MNPEVRKFNLERLLKELEKQGLDTYAKIAERYNGVSTGYLSQVRNGKRQMGEKFARDLENELGLTEFYLDQPIDNAMSITNNTGAVINGNNNTQNNYGGLTQNISVQDKATLDAISANYYKDMPLLDIDMAVQYALDPTCITKLILDNNKKILAFIPHTGNAFGVRLSYDIEGITPSILLKNDTVIIEPCMRPRSGDLVLVCLDYDKSNQRGMIARLHIGIDNKPMIKHSTADFEPMPVGSLVCGVVMGFKRMTMDYSASLARIDTEWDIRNSLVVEHGEI